MLWVAVIVVVFFGLIIWYTLTVLADKRDQTAEEAGQSQLLEQEEVQSTESTALDDATNANAAIEALLATDERILLTPENLGEYNKNANGLPNCEAGFVGGEGALEYTYTNEEYGFSADLPFNPDWGTQEYRLDPFDELVPPAGGEPHGTLAAIQFGLMGVAEGCGWYRFDNLSVRESRSMDDIMTTLSQEYGPLEPIVAPRQVTIGEFDAVEYEYGGLCGQPTVEVMVGPYNLAAHKICGFGEAEDDLKYLRDILATVRLL